MTKKNKKSHEIFADFYADLSTGSNRMAAAFGVSEITAVSWARPKASDINPTATGKNNPLDQAIRAARIIHPHDPARAREIVALLEAECDELDRQAGTLEATENGNPCAAIARLVEAQTQLLVMSLGNCADPEHHPEMLAIARRVKVLANQLESCLKGLLKTDNTEKTKNDKAKRKKGYTR